MLHKKKHRKFHSEIQNNFKKFLYEALKTWKRDQNFSSFNLKSSFPCQQNLIYISQSSQTVWLSFTNKPEASA